MLGRGLERAIMTQDKTASKSGSGQSLPAVDQKASRRRQHFTLVFRSRSI